MIHISTPEVCGGLWLRFIYALYRITNVRFLTAHGNGIVGDERKYLHALKGGYMEPGISK